MSYCVNPSCPKPKNPKNAQVCQACGSSLRLHNRYQILGILGKGGFGATFAAADLSLPGTPVCVVKQLRPATDDPNVYRMAKQLFEREAETLGKVGNHPQVPRLLDYFEEGQQFYLLQEYVKGQNLHQEIKKKGPFSEAGVKQFLTEILPIMDYIHAQKVIHRDIKPANLIRRQTDRKLVVIDFGAVKTQVNTVLASSSSQTALTAFAVGTAGFAPPEQMAMRPVYASDIYAIGVTCVYLLTGKSPKEIGCDPSTGEIAWEHYITLNEKFADVLKKMLEVSVKHRFKTAQEVLDAMDVLPYEEGMLGDLITMPSSKPNVNESSQAFPASGVTGISRANRVPNSSISRVRRNTTPNTEISPRTRGTYGANTQLRGNSPETEMRMPTNMASSRLNTSNTSIRSPSASRIAGAAGNINFQVAGNPGSTKKKTRETTHVQKPKKLTAKAILESYQKGRKDFTQQDLPDLNLARANLQGINFYQSKMEQSNFQGCNLSRADFGRTNLYKARLKNANLTDAYLGYADLGDADLSKANLAGANLKYANLRGTNLCGANLADAHVTADQLALARTNWSTVMPSGKRGLW
ncbi:MAG: pentapeptide repeat-containing protein [Microcystaceae cyanobacterium]